jgi:hypothetical protein
MKQLLWVVPAAIICGVLLAGRADMKRFRAMRDM